MVLSDNVFTYFKYINLFNFQILHTKIKVGIKKLPTNKI